MPSDGWEHEDAELEAEVTFVTARQPPAFGEEWHFISAAWMEAWRKYAISADARRRPSPPGPITNWHLLKPDQQYRTAKEGLVRERDYHCITKAVWELLQQKYRGGPAITSKTQNIATAKTHDMGIMSERVEGINKGAGMRNSKRVPWPGSVAITNRHASADYDANNSRRRASPQELAEELEFVKQHDRPKRGEKWHLIHSKWLQQWTRYTRDGGKHPGPVSNWELLDEKLDFHAPKLALAAGQHYRGLSPAAWDYLQSTYGGGPRITSKELDIYAVDEVIFANELHTQSSLNIAQEQLAAQKPPRKTVEPQRSSSKRSTANTPSRASSKNSSPSTSTDEGTLGTGSSSMSSFLWTSKHVGRLKKFAATAFPEPVTFEV